MGSAARTRWLSAARQLAEPVGERTPPPHRLLLARLGRAVLPASGPMTVREPHDYTRVQS